ncbi:hypothetical protein [Actinophytocola sp.]|uniref:hypothetical protein n=1 Tax=Actinophytocola sp. TaxID=1872138 RepID=UPI002ED4D185
MEAATRQPVRQFGEVENALAESLTRLSELPDGPAEQVIEHTWHVATDTAAAGQHSGPGHGRVLVGARKISWWVRIP